MHSMGIDGVRSAILILMAHQPRDPSPPPSPPEALQTSQDVQAWIRRFRILHDDMFSRLPQQAIDKCHRKLGSVRRERMGRSAPFEAAVLKDYAVWGLPLAGSTVAQRYAAAPVLSPEPEDAVLLPAMADARFSLFAVRAKAADGILQTEDLLTEQSEVLMGMETGMDASGMPADAAFLAGWYVRLEDRVFPGAGSLWLDARQRDILLAMLSGPYPLVREGLAKLKPAATYDPGRFAAFVVKSILDARLYHV